MRGTWLRRGPSRTVERWCSRRWTRAGGVRRPASARSRWYWRSSRTTPVFVAPISISPMRSSTAPVSFRPLSGRKRCPARSISRRRTARSAGTGAWRPRCAASRRRPMASEPIPRTIMPSSSITPWKSASCQSPSSRPAVFLTRSRSAATPVSTWRACATTCKRFANNTCRCWACRRTWTATCSCCMHRGPVTAGSSIAGHRQISAVGIISRRAATKASPASTAHSWGWSATNISTCGTSSA